MEKGRKGMAKRIGKIGGWIGKMNSEKGRHLSLTHVKNWDPVGPKRSNFSLADTTNINCSHTTKSVVCDNNEGVILLCVLRRSRSSHIWRLRRVSVGLSLDYG